jgi:hypothetical protein
MDLLPQFLSSNPSLQKRVQDSVTQPTENLIWRLDIQAKKQECDRVSQFFSTLFECESQELDWTYLLKEWCLPASLANKLHACEDIDVQFLKSKTEEIKDIKDTHSRFARVMHFLIMLSTNKSFT